jgi:hypothetical protein
LDIVVIAICAVIAGAESWDDIALFGEAKRAWFTTVLGLPNGIPSHAHFNWHSISFGTQLDTDGP